MRISDWSSDVCSSDLDPGPADRMAVDHIHLSHRALDGFARIGSIVVGLLILSGVVNSWILVGPSRLGSLRSEERREGKVCVRTCSSRWSPYRYNKPPHSNSINP